MENHTQQRYQSSPAVMPASSRSSIPTPSSRASTAKPLPSLPAGPAPPYRDDPPEGDDANSVALPLSMPRHRAASDLATAQLQVFIPPYTDAVLENDDDDDVPLAHLYPYPTEAPPSYHVAVRDSFRATLIQHIPPTTIMETDEEVGMESLRSDDVRFTVERVVAAIIVSMLLLVFAAFFALVAFGSLRLGK